MHVFTIKDVNEFLSLCLLSTMCRIKYGKFIVNGVVDCITYVHFYDSTM